MFLITGRQTDRRTNGQKKQLTRGDSVDNGIIVPWTCQNLELTENKFPDKNLYKNAKRDMSFCLKSWRQAKW